MTGTLVAVAAASPVRRIPWSPQRRRPTDDPWVQMARDTVQLDLPSGQSLLICVPTTAEEGSEAWYIDQEWVQWAEHHFTLVSDMILVPGLEGTVNWVVEVRP